MSRPDPQDCLAALRSICPFSLEDPDTIMRRLLLLYAFTYQLYFSTNSAQRFCAPFCISLTHVVSNRIHACLNQSVTVFSEVHRAETFQRIRLWRSVQYAGLSLCLRKHNWGLLRHDPQCRLHWNEGEQNILTLTLAQFGSFSFHITRLNPGSAN